MAIKIVMNERKPAPKQLKTADEGAQESKTEVKSRRGRPSSGKVIVTLRLSPDVLDKLKSSGKGWQSRVDVILRKAVGL